MEITKEQLGASLELKVRGRLDAYWAEHLSASIEEAIRHGSHHLRLNLAGVDYLSSAGIRVLLKFYKQLGAIHGSLSVTEPSETVASILELAGLASLVIAPGEPAVKDEAAAEPRRLERGNAVYHVFDVTPGATLKCTVVGDPAKLETSGYGPADCRSQKYPDSTFGLGLGAFGTGFADCRERFGEFLALSGAAAYLPTDTTNVPDFMVSEGLLVPELEVLYGLSGQGSFAQLIRFEAKPEPPGLIPLADVLNVVLEVANANTVGIAMVAESAGLVGASLKRSLAQPPGDASPLSFPAVRDWLSFTTERAFDRTLCVVAGVASRQASPPLASMLRPIGPGSNASGHFHAAVFPYRPLQRGDLDLHTTVNALFSTESMLGLLHLLADDRQIDGVGQSEFLRGACWVGPITDIQTL
ncbi:MAG: STAS domain-containing protein [Limisphaerales bacterium]